MTSIAIYWYQILCCTVLSHLSQKLLFFSTPKFLFFAKKRVKKLNHKSQISRPNSNTLNIEQKDFQIRNKHKFHFI